MLSWRFALRAQRAASAWCSASGRDHAARFCTVTMDKNLRICAHCGRMGMCAFVCACAHGRVLQAMRRAPRLTSPRLAPYPSQPRTHLERDGETRRLAAARRGVRVCRCSPLCVCETLGRAVWGLHS